ncbi:YegP family protein [Chitinophaga solisilvae]|uniref:YegP family protein n=1 Tax=Chitinophaga solisilvae TaxID=1233460 RepID=A0A3S1D1R8_9BACT|nr:YegP family protein [Chitinophaga solisilvae]NSL87276.1 YegP family protein [Chitinophaga solisilvae]
MGKFHLKIAKDGQFYFNLKADNNQVILSSEMYTTKAACLNGIESVKTNSSQDGRYDSLTAKNGKFYFTLKAANGQVIGTSEMYESEAARDNGIASVKKNGPDAGVVED